MPSFVLFSLLLLGFLVLAILIKVSIRLWLLS